MSPAAADPPQSPGSPLESATSSASHPSPERERSTRSRGGRGRVPRDTRPIFWILIATLVACELLSLTGIAAPPHSGWIGPPPFLAAAFAGAFILFAAARPAKLDLFYSLCIAATLT